MSGQHEYRRRLNKSRKLGLITKGQAAYANVSHDSWCAIYQGRYCNCSPRITIECAGTIMTIGADGLLKEES